MTLSACTQLGNIGRIKAGINLPAMPDSLRRKCPDPGVNAGQDARKTIARHRKALAICNHRHGGTVKFYRDTKKEFSK